MSSTTMQTAQTQLPAMPLTIEGASVLHSMMRFRWTEWRKLTEPARAELVNEATQALQQMTHTAEGQSALFSLIGHKADLLLVHFRMSFDHLKAAELQLAQLRISDFLEPATSYLSVVELGLYESTVKLYRELAEKGIAPHSTEWTRETEQVLQRQREAMRPRLFPDIPPARYICFYPMDRRRAVGPDRLDRPEEHGMVGRRYAGTVRQIITGSIGFDDWEWGVDLFADDPLVFKRLIYEMRFDEVSAVYALFGTFYVGVRCPVSGLGKLLSGELPTL